MLRRTNAWSTSTSQNRPGPSHTGLEPNNRVQTAVTVPRSGVGSKISRNVAPETAAEVFELDPQLATALNELSPLEREALLLTAWEELTPTEAARALGIKPTAFRVRLLRARRRVEAKLAGLATAPDTKLTMERT